MKRSSGIIVAVIVLLAVAAWLVLQRPGESSVEAGDATMLVAYDSAAVDRLIISGAQGTVAFEQQAGRWIMVQPMKYRADESAVTTAIGKGRSIALASLVSSNPDKQSLFQLDSAGTLVHVFERGVEKALFRIGKPSTSYRETYVRAEGSNDVFLTRELLSTVFSKSVKDWRDKTIFKRNPHDIKNVGYRFGDTSFVLTFRDSMWKVDEKPASQPAVQPLLSALGNLQGDEFIDTPVTTARKLTATIVVDGVEIRFYQAPGAAKFVVQSSASPQWFEVQQWKAQQILKRRLELLPPS